MEIHGGSKNTWAYLMYAKWMKHSMAQLDNSWALCNKNMQVISKPNKLKTYCVLITQR